MIKNVFRLILLFITAISFALDTTVNARFPRITDYDVIFLKADSGFDLYIKKLNGIESILLTESQKDPQMMKTNYALQTDKFYPANGDEIRLLDGKELHTGYEAFYLVDSTVENYPGLGNAFHFFLPDKVYFGYSWARSGSMMIQPGMKINLRIFDRKYADYSGNFTDQWITLKPHYTSSNFRQDLIEDSRNLADKVNGKLVIQSEYHDLKTIIDDFAASIPAGNDADVVFIIDTTESMVEEMPVFKKEYPVIKKKLTDKINNLRFGLILYKDYGDIYVTKISGLSDNFIAIDDMIKSIIPSGGQDIPEARNEAIFELGKFDFKSANRYALLVTDAPAHVYPRGKITADDAITVLTGKKINFEIVCLQFK